MTRYNLVKLAEEVKDKKPGIIPGALGAGALLASGYGSIKNHGSKGLIEDIADVNHLGKVVDLLDEGRHDEAKEQMLKVRSLANYKKYSEDDRNWELKQLHKQADELRKERADLNSTIRQTFNDEASLLDKFLIGKKRLEDTDDASEHITKLWKRERLLNKAGIAAGAAGLGYGAYKYLNRDKNS